MTEGSVVTFMSGPWALMKEGRIKEVRKVREFKLPGEVWQKGEMGGESSR